MPRRSYTKRLLVEGSDEERLIPWLIEPWLLERHGFGWGATRDEAIVDIEEFKGVKNLLKPGVIEAELKASGLEQLGIIIDADEDLNASWRAVRNRCLRGFSDQLPEELPREGLVVESDSGLRLGVWIMPDNLNSGMLETFLTYLVPDVGSDVYQQALTSVSEAKSVGATFSEAHNDKAIIHTWLAWQDPPGRQLHQAVKERILDPDSVLSRVFVDWFLRLYQL